MAQAIAQNSLDFGGLPAILRLICDTGGVAQYIFAPSTMKALLVRSSFFLLFSSLTAEDERPINPNVSFQNLITGATRIVVRDGGDTWCVTPAATLEQPVLFEIVDAEEILNVAKNIKLKVGAKRNGCDCCGHPGVDWYSGNRRVAITGVKHGAGLMRSGIIATFTPDSKEWIRKWLLSHGLTEEQIK